MTGTVGQLDLLLTSPRVAAGLLTRSAWQALEQAELVLCSDLSDPTPVSVQHSGIPVGLLDARPDVLAARLVAEAGTARVLWLSSPDADPGLTDALASELSRVAAGAGQIPVVEVIVGSHDVPGARLLDVVAIMDRLRSPGGCPWDAEQSSETLVPYLLEEAYEAVEAIESGSVMDIREELGDVLLQVVFHARIGAERSQDSFDLDDVAADLVAKLVRRHPHVFSGGQGSLSSAEGGQGSLSSAEVERNWHQIKLAEKQRTSLLDGIPLAQPALARTAKVLARVAKSELTAAQQAEIFAPLSNPLAQAQREAIQASDRDPEGTLRAGLRELEQRVRRAEQPQGEND